MKATRILISSCLVDIVWYIAVFAMLARAFVIFIGSPMLINSAILISIFTNLFMYALVVFDQPHEATNQISNQSDSQLDWENKLALTGCWMFFIILHIVVNLTALVLLTNMSDYWTLSLLSLVNAYVIFITCRFVSQP